MEGLTEKQKEAEKAYTKGMHCLELLSELSHKMSEELKKDIRNLSKSYFETYYKLR